MFSLIYYEAKKFFKLKAVLYVFIALLVWLFICGTSVKQLNNVSAFDFQIFIIRIMGDFFILSLFFAFSSYSYGLDMERKTFKILRSKKTPVHKMYFAKIICGLIYNFIILGVIFFITYLIGNNFLATDGLSIDNLNLYVNGEKEALIFLFKLFSLQFIASSFISVLAFLIAIITNKIMYSIVLTPIFIFILDLGSNLKNFTLDWIIYLFPINVDVLYKEFARGNIVLRMVSLFIYTSALIVYSIYYLKKQDVMD